MLEDVLKWLARKEPGANQIRPVELISGVRVWEFDCEPPQNCVVAGLSVGHHETVFCQEGGGYRYDPGMDGRDGEENLASPLGGVGKAADPGSNIDGL